MTMQWHKVILLRREGVKKSAVKKAVVDREVLRRSCFQAFDTSRYKTDTD